MKYSIIGVVVPLAVLMVSYLVTELLYRHFAGRKD